MEKYRNFSLFFHFDCDPRFPPFLLYVRWKFGVTCVRRCVLFLFEGVLLPLSALERLHYFIVALPVASINVFVSYISAANNKGANRTRKCRATKARADIFDRLCILYLFAKKKTKANTFYPILIFVEYTCLEKVSHLYSS